MIFPGLPWQKMIINTGIPQGSRLSPILFAIYVEPLDKCPNPTNTFIFSYVDDTQITMSSSTWVQNTKILEEAFTKTRSLVALLSLRFSLHKTDLMHWRTPRDRSRV